MSITGNNEIYGGVGLTVERQTLPQISQSKCHTQPRRTDSYLSGEARNQPQSGLMMTINIGRLRQAIYNVRANGGTSDNARQEDLCGIVVATLQEEIS